VTTLFNLTAYNIEALCIQLIKQVIVPLVNGAPFLLVWDSARFHVTDNIKALLRHYSIDLAVILAGMTPELQPLDTHINKWIKAAAEEVTDRMEAEWEARADFKGWSLSTRRIFTTYVVAEVMRLLAKRGDLIWKSFIDTGIAVAPDGSEDHLIKIKCLQEANIRPDFTGWETVITTHALEEYEPDPVDGDPLFENLCVDYRKLTKRDLLVIAKARSLAVKSRDTKQRLVDLLEEQDAENFVDSEVDDEEVDYE